MIGAIIGDIAGSTREFKRDKSCPVELFPYGSHITDDTILLLATADKLLRNDPKITYADIYLEYASKYQGSQYGYGDRFFSWVKNSKPGQPGIAYNSLGNGSAMRIAPIGWLFNTLEETRKEARLSAMPTHNHPEGIKGAEVVASAIFLARNGKSKDEIAEYLEVEFNYYLNRPYEEVRDQAIFMETCPQSVEESLIAFLYSDSFEDAIYKAIALGGDADTQASIAGAVAEAYYKTTLPITLIEKYLDDEQRGVVEGFLGKIKKDLQ